MTVTTPSTAYVLARCMTWLKRFLIVTHAQQVAIALWILHTWAIDAADYTPYLYITAPEKGCGKTRVLEALLPVVCRPWLRNYLRKPIATFGNTTEAMYDLDFAAQSKDDASRLELPSGDIQVGTLLTA